MTHDFSNYLSPFSWRYGSQEMRKIFSEEYKYLIWRKIWVALAKAEYAYGVVSKKELQDLQKNQSNIDIQRILEIEKETGHDVVAAIREFAEKAKIGGKKIHLGATSMDINDNADIYRFKQGLVLIEDRLRKLLTSFSRLAVLHAKLPCLAFTHLNPAEPTTLGYRLSFYAQDLLTDFEMLQFVKSQLKGKGMKGAVGTAASYNAIIAQSGQMEEEVMKELGLEAVLISTQVYPRKNDFLLMSLLNSLALSLAKFAGDIRILQTPLFGEWNEPFGKKQVGSSAMPFKRNPVNSEKICSLARIMNQLCPVIGENAASSLLERTLDDSASRRIVIPEAFLLTDEICLTGQKLIDGLSFNEPKINFNLSQYASFAALESILLEAVKKGADRQSLHEVLRDIAMNSWQKIQAGESNPTAKFLYESDELKKYLTPAKISELMNVTGHVGTAPGRALKLAALIKATLKMNLKRP